MNDDTQGLLSQLRDIHTPEVSAWPAPGWWLLAGAVVLLLIVGFVWRRQRARGGWLRQAHAELLDIRQHMNRVPPEQALGSLSQLTRRVVLARLPRTEVASVQGDEWLELLDRLSGEPVFTQGYGNLLATGPYRRNSSCSAEELDGLADAVEQLINTSARTPAVGTDVVNRQRAMP